VRCRSTVPRSARVGIVGPTQAAKNAIASADLPILWLYFHLKKKIGTLSGEIKGCFWIIVKMLGKPKVSG
jgi:hypothetical protein